MTRTLIVYALKRLAIAIPVLFVVSFIAFFLSIAAPGDIVEEYSAHERDMVPGTRTFTQRNRDYRQTSEEFGKHLPPFYFNVQPASFPDTLHRVLRKDERNNWKTLLYKYGDWSTIQQYRQDILGLLNVLESMPRDSLGWVTSVSQDVEFLLINSAPERIDFLNTSMRAAVPETFEIVHAALDRIDGSYEQVVAGKAGFKAALPSFHWYGSNNQYHRWLSDILHGNFGISTIDKRPVSKKIFEAITWTLRINLAAIFLAFLIAIPLGVASAIRAGKWFDRATSTILFAFFAIPSFWMATLLVIFFTTPEYGQWTDLFPTSGIGEFRYASGLNRLGILASHLFLPVLCLLLATLAYLTRQMRGGMIREAEKDYIRMARAKGLTDRAVYWKHAFRNALFPMITLLGAAIPASISGSVIIEVIFNIPGMGRLLYESILSQDWPVVFAMIMLVSLLTVVGYLVSDLLYRRIDPRVRLTERQ